MSKRFDNRSVATFKKDIKFGTMLEKYFFREWLQRIKSSGTIKITSWADNGCGNDGEFIKSGSTFGADYIINGTAKVGGKTVKLKSEPIEIKWVPTAGKFTLKERDLQAYIKERANILFIYNSVRCGTNLRKPKNYDLDKHIKMIESVESQLRWGIMWSSDVKKFYDYVKANDLIRPINYMGGKLGTVLKQEDFDKWFRQEEW